MPGGCEVFKEDTLIVLLTAMLKQLFTTYLLLRHWSIKAVQKHVYCYAGAY